MTLVNCCSCRPCTPSLSTASAPAESGLSCSWCGHCLLHFWSPNVTFPHFFLWFALCCVLPPLSEWEWEHCCAFAADHRAAAHSWGSPVGWWCQGKPQRGAELPAKPKGGAASTPKFPVPLHSLILAQSPAVVSHFCHNRCAWAYFIFNQSALEVELNPCSFWWYSGWY